MILRHGNIFLSREPKVSSFVISIWKAAISAEIRFVIPCLETITNVQSENNPLVEVVLFDGAAIVCMLKPVASKNVEECSREVIIP